MVVDIIYNHGHNFKGDNVIAYNTFGDYLIFDQL